MTIGQQYSLRKGLTSVQAMIVLPGGTATGLKSMTGPHCPFWRIMNNFHMLENHEQCPQLLNMLEISFTQLRQ